MQGRVVGAALAAVILVIMALHVHVQRRGEVRVVRAGDDLRVLRRMVGWAPRYGTTSCLVSDGLRFGDTTIVTDADERQFPAQIRFHYDVPATIPPDFPNGTWCDALRQRVRELTMAWTAAAARDLLIADKRSAGRLAAAEIERQLRSAGITARDLTVRFVVPDTLASARTIPEIQARVRKTPPVIFVGLDGADWSFLDRCMAAGLMPNLSALRAEGRWGTLMTDHPPLSPLLWNTMMTGVGPLEHRVLDFTRFHPPSGAREPITVDERRAPAIWNMATWGGKSVATFGIWATWPAEPVRGLMVSDRFFAFLTGEEASPPGAVFPPSRDRWAREIRSNAEAQIGYQRIREYLPSLSERDFKSSVNATDPYAHPVTALHRILAETETYHQLAKSYLTSKSPDLTILYVQGTDSIGHVFAPYNAPKQPEVTEKDFHQYKDVAGRYFQYLDTILGEYRRLAREKNAVLMIASDHGFRWGEGRPTELSSLDAPTAAKWHRNEGIYLLTGPGIMRGKGAPASIIQVAPTLLALTGLPPSSSIKAAPLDSVSSTGMRVDYARHFVPAPLQPAAAGNTTEEMAKLRALGYVGSTEPASAPANRDQATRTAGSYNNEGLILRSSKRLPEAVTAFENALKLDPEFSSAAWNLSELLFTQKQLDRSDQLLIEALENGLPEGDEAVIGRAIGYQRSGNAPRSLRLIDAAVRARPHEADLLLFRGRYRVDRGDCASALEDFRAAQQLQPRNAMAFASAGLAQLCLGDSQSAAGSFQQSLAIDPNQPRLRRFLNSQR